jgi:hypothetical protein
MNKREAKVELDPAIVDYAATKELLKIPGLLEPLGSVPFVGSLLAEVAGNVLPNQRIDRITKFAEALERRLANLEHEFIQTQLTDE